MCWVLNLLTNQLTKSPNHELLLPLFGEGELVGASNQ